MAFKTLIFYHSFKIFTGIDRILPIFCLFFTEQLEFFVDCAIMN
ncbi:hypothetical protein HMP0721_1951 [Pseudoramibacter alactolyticus ATCC 23263]|uniref:Uncharacterized protein n=1 Tax=Pseudoramibacter alactolyticus ATCC 23263 TaxID=887929 RepID=E6MIW6_9FIRM|nr:hypothetical protein HMP0721_1951 [Pseudoramibacter alactolyticus ATCC 23263]